LIALGHHDMVVYPGGKEDRIEGGLPVETLDP
jgi:hypothetical protein